MIVNTPITSIEPKTKISSCRLSKNKYFEFIVNETKIYLSTDTANLSEKDRKLEAAMEALQFYKTQAENTGIVDSHASRAIEKLNK